MSASDQSTPISEGTEPRVGRAAVPVWLIILLFVMVYWGMVYFDLHGAWFNPEVYAPYRSRPELEAMQPRQDDNAELFLKGKQMFSLTCAVCHMETGVGNPANGCPPLVGSEWVTAPGPGRITRIVSKGLIGPLEVKGQSYGTGTMLPIGDQLPGDEKEKAESIAAIISYVRKAFGNVPVAVKPEQVQAIREEIKGHSAPFTATELKAVPEDK